MKRKLLISFEVNVNKYNGQARSTTSSFDLGNFENEPALPKKSYSEASSAGSNTFVCACVPDRSDHFVSSGFNPNLDENVRIRQGHLFHVSNVVIF